MTAPVPETTPDGLTGPEATGASVSQPPAGLTGPDETTARPPLVAFAHAVEEDHRLDRVVAALRPRAQALLADAKWRDLLLGRQLGHSLHPLLTDAPLGAWMSAVVLDLVGGRSARPAARRLVGIGVLSAVPTAITGLADWAHTEQRESRVGVVHAAGNSVGLLLFSASWVSRHREHQGRGVVLGLLATAVVSASGYLGAHLAIARNVGARDESFADSLPVREAGRTGDQLT